MILNFFSQIHNRAIDAFVTKDRKSMTKMMEPLSDSHNLNFEFIDLSIPLNNRLGRLF